MSEWFKEHDWKSCVRLKRTGGSNPLLCANNKNTPFWGVFSIFFACFWVLFVVFLSILYPKCVPKKHNLYTFRFYYIDLPFLASSISYFSLLIFSI